MTTSSEPDKQSVAPIVNPATARIPQLDSIRGIAILLVILWHYFIVPMPNATPILAFIKKILSLSWSGVDLFFVLSGFLIGSILLENKTSNNYYKVFYIRRACRIFPLYYAVVIIYIVVVSNDLFWSHPLNVLFYYDKLPFAGYLTYTQNFFMLNASTFGPKLLDVTWSLAFEEQFYLLMPLFIRLAPYNKLPIYLILLIVLAPILRMLGLILDKTGMAAFFLLPLRMDSLLLGVLTAYLLRYNTVVQFVKKHFWFIKTAFLVIVTSLIALSLLSSQNLLRTTFQGNVLFFLAVAYILLLLIFLFSENRFLKLISYNKLLRLIGMISYSAYLIHNPMIRICHIYLLNQSPKLTNYADIFATSIALLLTFSLSWISYHFFEKHFVRFGHKFNW